MPRATTRSQKANKASQPRQSQRTQPDPDEDIDEQSEQDDDDEQRMDVDEDDTGRGSDNQRKANALVRLALFVEYRRTPLRRDEIMKKVMGTNGRSFNRVFDHAQDKLRKVFGMELVELRSRAELAKEALGADDDDDARKGATSKKKATAGSKTYILRSLLDPELIKIATATDEQILEQEALDQPSDDDDDDLGSRSSGSILSWSSADQVGPIGILYVILALILVSGRVMPDADLRSYLKKLRLPSSGKVNFSAQSTHPSMSVDQYLTNLMRQGYIDRHQIGDTKKKGGVKRVRAQEDDDGLKYEWRWGNRAESEIGEHALAEFIAEFMVGEKDDDDDEGRKRNKRGPSILEKMMSGIEKAAGGNLAALKAS